MNDYSSNYSSASNDSSRSQSPLSRKKMRRFVKRSTILPFALVGVVVIIVGVLLLRNATGTTSAAPVLGANDKRVDIQKPKAQQQINKDYSFPLKDQTGKEVSKFTYKIQDAELRDEIVVKGQPATAVKGRTFLIVNIKITNNYDKDIQLNVKDFVRLSVNNSTEKLAPDIHNDPVDVQAISTKYTRVGFPINDTDKNLELQVGEISGTKDTIKLNL
jgi:hypothetical protein